MEIPVLIEAMDSRGFRATAIPSRLFADGSSREEALECLGQLVEDRISQGQLVPMQVPAPRGARRRKSLAGMWKDHPDIDEVVRNIQEYRKQVDADPDRL